MTTKQKTQDDEARTANVDTPTDAVVADQQADETVKARLQAQYGEYGQWVAAWDIHHEAALAFAAGHPIPATLVDADGRVVVSMHRCHHPGDQRCERFNEPDDWSEPGAAVRPPNFKE